MTPMTPTPPVPPAAPTPQKPKTAQVIRMTKGLAKPAMAPYFFRIILLLALEALTGYALSMVFAGLAQRLGLSLTVKVWVYAFDLTAALLSLLGNALLLPLTLGVTEFLMKAFRRSGPRVADVFLWYADGVHWKRVLEYYVYAVLIGLIAIPLYAVPANWLMETINAVTTDFGQQMTNGVLSPVIHWSLVNFRAVGVSLLLMLYFGTLGLTGTVVLLAMGALQLILLLATYRHTPLHDLLAGTVEIDLPSQMIFDSREALIAYKEKMQAERAAAQPS